MSAIVKLVSLFSAREKRKLMYVTAAVVVTAVLEVVGIGAVGPFMSVVADPSLIETQPILNTLYTRLGFETHQSFITVLGAALFLLVLGGNAFKMLTVYAIHRFGGTCRYRMGLRLFRQYLHQPYSYFLDHNSSELSKNILSEIDLVIGGVLRPSMNGFARALVVLGIVTYLLITSPLLALSIGVVLAIIHTALFRFVRPRLVRYGDQMRDSNKLRYKATGEAFGAIKDVKILGKEASFERLYAAGARDFAWSQAAKQIILMLPRHALEAATFGMMILLVIVLQVAAETPGQVLPLLAVYGFAAYKLMPALQEVFGAVAQLRYYGKTVDVLHADMQSLAKKAGKANGGVDGTDDVIPLPFRYRFQLRDVSFSYPTSSEAVLDSIDLDVIKNTTVGFVGTTGCGKTTLVDVIMGLLEPQTGALLVDGEPVQDSVRPWQRNFGYVPQHIFLSDDSIAANIAFGIPEGQRDSGAVERAARIANIHDFVVDELPDGYNTTVGERGIRLSGGQRQRVGIARALYHDPEILVMDEATSALDSVTEDAVMDAIHRLMHRKTIVIIAHRITTVQPCDEIFLMERGRIIESGTYDELVSASSRFRAMAKVAG
jgi:ATP-binding cassette, subfamily B, bacterial PglK